MRYDVPMIVIGLAMSPAQVNAQTSVQTFEVEVSTTGMHPSGMQWDGSRIYYLPFEVSTTSPPDIDLCVIQADQIACLGKTESAWLPICPDAERCRFKAVAIDPGRSFGLVVFDHDRLGEDATATISEGVGAWGRAAVDSAGRAESGGVFDWGRDAALAAGRMVRETGDGIAALNRRRLEWIETIILTPSQGETPEALAELETQIRDHIRSVAMPSPFGGHDKRLSGPMPVQSMDACLWPSPPCQLTYVTFNLELVEASLD